MDDTAIRQQQPTAFVEQPVNDRMHVRVCQVVFVDDHEQPLAGGLQEALNRP